MSGEKLKVRQARESDVAAVLPMVSAQYALHVGWDEAKFGTKPGFETGFARWMAGLASDERGVFLVAVDEDDWPVGFLVATTERELPLYLLKEYGFIHDVWVEEGHRGRGGARGLVEGCLARFKAIGVSQVRCETAQVNEDARVMFRKLGFRPTTVVMLKEI